MDDGSDGTGYCSPATSAISDRFSEDILEVLQCDIWARPGAPTPDDLAADLRTVSSEGDRLVLRFAHSAADAVRQFAAAECVCCGGMGWEVRCGNTNRLWHTRSAADHGNGLARTRGCAVKELLRPRKILVIALAACVPCIQHP